MSQGVEGRESPGRNLCTGKTRQVNHCVLVPRQSRGTRKSAKNDEKHAAARAEFQDTIKRILSNS